MKKTIYFFALFITLAFTNKSNELTEKNYRIYSVKLGKEVQLQDIVNEMNNYDVLIFGEEHNDSVSHYLEFQLLTLLEAKYGNKTALSLEMFDRDVQTVMDEYLSANIREKHFLKDARVWSNYKDYKNMIEFAKTKQLKVVCANAASRYTNLAGRKGQSALMSLPKESKKHFAPLPYDTASGEYYNKLMGLSNHGSGTKSDSGKSKMPAMMMGGFNLVTAQSLWDATMAFSISEYLKNNKGCKLLQINGKFHSDEKMAIYTQLKKYNKKAKALVISTLNDESFPTIKWENYKHLGDYIIVTDHLVPKTYKSN